MASSTKTRITKPKKAFIWMVRHGQAEGNGHHMLNGNQIDAPLTLEGKRQAKALVKHWRKEKPEVLLSSPLTRAVSTTRELAHGWHMSFKLTKLAEEQDYGDFTGQPVDKILAQRCFRPYFTYGKTLDQIYILRCPHGESWAQMKKRATKLLRWMDHQYAGKRVVVVSHGDFINCCYGVRFGLSDQEVFKRRGKPNCGYVRL